MATIGTQRESPLVVIVGPTASGKTGLAIQLAREFEGEVISADSRAIYRGLDIGTAKPSVAERQGITHWGIDLVDPGERFTAADFKSYATAVITDIRSRGKTPILVGGTGLYIDAVLYDFEFPAGSNDTVRRGEFDRMSLSDLHKYCHENNIKLPENKMNKRYVINAILRNGYALKRRLKPIENTIVVGISTEKNTLRKRIHQRAQTIFNDSVIVEARRAASRFGWSSEAMKGNIYPLIRQLEEGEISQQEAMQRFEILDWRLAKRQLTWLKRSEHVHWLSLAGAYDYVARYLADARNP